MMLRNLPEMNFRSHTMAGAMMSVTKVSMTSCQTSTKESATTWRESRIITIADFAALESATFASFTNFDAMMPVEFRWYASAGQWRMSLKSSFLNVTSTDCEAFESR